MSRLDPLKEAVAAKALRESIAALDGDDEVLLLDTVEGQTGLFEAIDKLLERMAESRVMVAGLEVVASDLDARRRRFEERIKFDRALIEQALLIADIGDKIERPMGTLYLSSRATKVEITTESDIPAQYWKAGAPTLDKKTLSEDLKNGQSIPGAVLSNGAPSLSIRTK